jgi:signal recognition particle GTPase
MNIFNHFKHLNLTDDQAKAINSLESFLQISSQVFMLKGFAGSGKTTILKGFVDYLKEIDKKFVLMAPTGRAANVIQEKTGFEALTIHKSIFGYTEEELLKTLKENTESSCTCSYCSCKIARCNKSASSC